MGGAPTASARLLCGTRGSCRSPSLTPISPQPIVTDSSWCSPGEDYDFPKGTTCCLRGKGLEIAYDRDVGPRLNPVLPFSKVKTPNLLVPISPPGKQYTLQWMVGRIKFIKAKG